MSRILRAAVVAVLLIIALRSAIAAPATQPDQTARAAPTTLPTDLVDEFSQAGPILLHLNGVGGYLPPDYNMLSGLREAHVEARLFHYDWTENAPGMGALQAYGMHQVEAQKVADLLALHLKADPHSPVYLIGHSGGCAIAVYALAKLPKGDQIDTLVLLAPALSPTYDLSAALAHVKGNVYVFSSTLDQLILSTGTRAFGTMDGIRTDGAGFDGFVRPPHGDVNLYAKIVPEPYREEWIKYGDLGDHIGTLHRRFAQAIIGPLLKPAVDAATTRPAGDSEGRQG
jgi:pimeloyl-ACP methyl ester carboxylesterase